MAKQRIELYDTTLRDGTQGETLSFTVHDKLQIAKKLDAFGIDFIEGGWPGSNPKDQDFFRAAKTIRFAHSRICAFGATRKAGNSASEDKNLNDLIAAQTPVVTIFGKSWDLHVKEALHVSLADNIALIKESVHYLKKHVPQVFYDAEHFFDGYRANPEYALRTLTAAHRAGADRLVLCETNGGMLPHELAAIFREVKAALPKAMLGIHCHNDAEVGVANSLAAICEGAIQVHGTVNGYGERCGNANLCSIIPAIVLKLKRDCNVQKTLGELTELSHFVSEMANLPHRREQPYVGESAFAHKGGVHVSAILKNPLTYEHIDPTRVGNRQRVLVSDLSGVSTILYKAKELGITIKKGDPRVRTLLATLKDLENRGYQFEAAEASFEILLRKSIGKWTPFFELLKFQAVETMGPEVGDDAGSCATIDIRVNGEIRTTTAKGVGPVHALDKALRQALSGVYPQLNRIELGDYKVRVLPGNAGTSSMVRVLIEFTDHSHTWRTVGVSANIIEASYRALADGIEYHLLGVH